MTGLIPISDFDDPRIASFRDIRERDLVGREGLFIAEGLTVLDVLLRERRHEPLALLIAERKVTGLSARIERLDVPVYVASDVVLERVAGFAVHRGVLALGRRAPDPDIAVALAGLPRDALIVALIGIANHDNMGGIFRNAAAFGASLVLIDETSCDPLYRKAIRVSAGGALRVPFARIAGTDILDVLAGHSVEVLALSPSGATALTAIEPGGKRALLLGAEGPGLPAGILQRTRTIRIPMAGRFDSLNVATTSGIALHHLRNLMPVNPPL